MILKNAPISCAGFAGLLYRPLILLAILCISLQLWAAPTILRCTESARPGEVIGLHGANFGYAQVWLTRVTGSMSTFTPQQRLQVINRSNDGTYAAAVLPTDLTYGLYAIWVYDGGAYNSTPVWINRARGTGFDVPEIAPGGTFRIWGRNLSVSGATPTVRFYSGGTYYTATVTGGDAYSLNVSAPANLPTAGTFTVKVSNGHGDGTYRNGETNMAATLPSRAGTTDYFGLGVPWGADFSLTFFNNVYNVKTDARLALHAVGDGVTNDAPAIQAAVNAASAAGGGVVYCPTGNYRLVSTTSAFAITMKNNVVLKGDGISSTRLFFGDVNQSGLIDGIKWPDNTALGGLMDFTLENVNTYGTQWSTTGVSKLCNRIFYKRVKFLLDRGICGGITCYAVSPSEGINKFLMTDCELRHTRSGSPLNLGAAKNLVVRNSTIYSASARTIACVTKNALFENNAFIRTAEAYDESGSFTYGDGTENLTLLNNTFSTQVTLTDPLRNDSETILSEGYNWPNRSLGTATSGTGTTLTDTSKSWGTIGTDYIVAITQGAGAGQWRAIASNTANTITVSPAWTITPNSTSRYVVTKFDTRQCLIKGNVLTGMRKGIYVYQGGCDNAYVNNTLTDSGTILLRADERLAENRFQLCWENLVADNVIRSLSGRWPAQINLAFNCADSTAHGLGLLANEIRRNVVDGASPNAILEERWHGIFNEVKSGYTVPTLDNTSVLSQGNIFDGNTTIDCQYPYTLSTGVYNTTIWNNTVKHATNASYLDEIGTANTHGALETTVQYAGIKVGGLKGEYYNNRDFTAYKLVRHDPQVLFDWATNAPYGTMGADDYSVRWTGTITPDITSNYTFTTRSDGYVRLYVNDVLRIDQWNDHALADHSSSAIALTGGQTYNIKLEYAKATGSGVIKLLWADTTRPLRYVDPSDLTAPSWTGNPSNPPLYLYSLGETVSMQETYDNLSNDCWGPDIPGNGSVSESHLLPTIVNTENRKTYVYFRLRTDAPTGGTNSQFQLSLGGTTMSQVASVVIQPGSTTTLFGRSASGSVISKNLASTAGVFPDALTWVDFRLIITDNRNNTVNFALEYTRGSGWVSLGNSTYDNSGLNAFTPCGGLINLAYVTTSNANASSATYLDHMVITTSSPFPYAPGDEPLWTEQLDENPQAWGVRGTTMANSFISPATLGNGSVYAYLQRPEKANVANGPISLYFRMKTDTPTCGADGRLELTLYSLSDNRYFTVTIPPGLAATVAARGATDGARVTATLGSTAGIFASSASVVDFRLRVTSDGDGTATVDLSYYNGTGWVSLGSASSANGQQFALGLGDHWRVEMHLRNLTTTAVSRLGAVSIAQ